MNATKLAWVVVVCCCLVAWLAAVGCQPAGQGAATYPVTGTVTYQGKPVDGARVVLSPAAEGTGAQAAAGETDAQGRYKIDAVPGEYIVLVSKYPKPAGTGGGGQEYTPPEEGQVAPTPENLLPKKYETAVTSPLRLRVEARENVFDIQLSD